MRLQRARLASIVTSMRPSALALATVLLWMTGCAVSANGSDLSEGSGTAGTAPATSEGQSDGPTDGSTSAATGGGSNDADEPNTGGFVFDLGSPDAPEEDGPCGCSPGTDLVYALSSMGELWTFDPASTSFERVATVDCPVFSNVMFSLAIDRKGEIYVEFRSTGDVYRMSLDDFSCQDPGYEPPDTEPRRFGLGFVQSDDGCERMLGLSFDGTDWSEGPAAGRLVEIETSSMHRAPLATIDYNGGEFAGTGEGRLFAFAGAPEAELVELLLDGSVIETTPLPGVELTEAFAMAHWGGDFYFFVQSALNPTLSTVLRLDYDESDGPGRTLSEVGTAPVLVVGASSSTCAPTEPAG